MRVETLTPVIDASPGDQVACRVRIHNDGRDAASYRLRLVGLDEPEPVLTVDGGAIEAGGTVDVDVPFTVPAAFAAGQHPLAFEVVSDRPGERTAVAPVAVDIGSLSRVILEVRPPTIRGRRTGKFEVEITNHEPVPLDLTIEGHGPDVKVRLRQPLVSVRPGQKAIIEGRVRGPRHLVGETRQHLVTLSAHGRGAPISTTAPYRQPSLIPRPLRVAVVLITVLAIWAAAVGAVAVWWSNRDDDTPDASQSELVDTNGDGVGDTPADEVPIGELEGDDAGDAGAAGGGDEAAGDEGAEAQRTTTSIGGSIKAGDTGEDAGVVVRIAPTRLGVEDTAAQGIVRPVPGRAEGTGDQGNRDEDTGDEDTGDEDASDQDTGDESSPTKFWPVRAAPLSAGGAAGITGGVPMPRQTLSEEPVLSDSGGAWVIPDVPLGRSYEVNFAKSGFDSQSFVVTPPADGSPVKLDVELVPAQGALGGVVSGPSGRLGGVQIEVSDGTITASATTSTDPATLGQWRIDSLGTPATWTVTASLRGYGTEVLQVTLPAGGTSTNLDIAMTPGVGTIGGRVRLDGQPVGGVRLTVVDGDLERTTTSLTEGDTGAYRFPSLPIPGEYTVTLDVEGFITETRRVVLDGNVDDVDFDLRRTTASLSGLVTSDALGPLVNASVVITRDELEFRTVTAAPPQAGAFGVQDLPPGTYLVTFGRYDHRPVSQSVTLTAGQSLDLGVIGLVYNPSPDLPQTGSVVVRLFDSNDAPLTGGTVKLLDPTTGAEVRSITGTDTQNSFSFTDLAIGTYDIRATHPIHRTVTRRISIGLGEAPPVEINMVKLGQASGRLIDSIADEVRGGYEVTVYRLLGSGARDPSFSPLRVLPELLDGPNGEELRWQTPVNSLTTGTYEVEVTKAPDGYLVVPDQLLDPALPPDQKMRFALPPDLETPFLVGDIEADPYPALSGRVFRPVLTGSTVTLEAFESDQLDATLACGGRAPVAGVPTDEVPPTTTPDSFVFDKFLTQSENLIGACRLQVSAPGLLPATIDLATPMAVSNGTTSSDQRVNVALIADSGELAGTVYWIDEGLAGNPQVPLGGVAIAADGVIVGFDGRQNAGTDAEPVGVPQDVRVTSATDGSGAWASDQQVFGRSRYSFTTSNIAPGAIDVAIDGVGADPEVTVGDAATTAIDATGSGYGIELRQPADGSVNGNVTIITNGPPQYSTVHAVGDGPGTAAFDVTADPTTGAITAPARAGTWSVDLPAPAGHVRIAPLPLPPPEPAITYPIVKRVEPGLPANNFNARFVELADIEVRVRDDSAAISVGGVRPTVSVVAVSTAPPLVPADPAASNRPATQVGTGGDLLVSDLAVAAADSAAATTVRYLVTVAMNGYDTSAATITIGGVARPDLTSATNIPVDVAAGSSVVVTVDLPEYGSLTGFVQGRNGGASVPPANYVDLPFTELTVKRAVPVDALGVDIPGATPVPLQPVAADPNGFTFSAPPGRYRIDVQHPNYQVGLLQGAGFAPAIVTVANETPVNQPLPYVLEIARGRIVGTVVDAVLAPGADEQEIDLATVKLFLGATQVGTDQTTDATGAFDFPSLVPDTYRIEVTKPGRFSMTANIVVPTGTTELARTRTLTVPLPLVDAAISLTVRAQNIDGKPVLLPSTYTVSRTYDEPAIDAGGALIPNTVSGDQNYLRTPTAGATTETFSMTDLPYGAHTLSFTTVTGYDPIANVPVPLSVAGSKAVGPVTYVAKNRTVAVSVVTSYPTDGSALSGANVKLIPPGPLDEAPTCADQSLALPSPSATGGTYTFANVPPRNVAYKVCVTAALHAPNEISLRVDPGDPTVIISGDVAKVEMTPNAASIGGAVRRQDSAGTTPIAFSGARVELLKSGTVVTSTTSGSGGAYSFDVTEVGLYTVRASDPTVPSGYATRSIAVGTTEISLGESRTANVTLPKLGSLNVVVNGPTDPATITVVVSTPSLSITPTRNSRTFTFTGLDPDVDHTFTATTTETGWYATTGVGNPDIGAAPATPTTITMARREITLTVTGPPAGTSVRVGARFPAGSTGTEVANATKDGGGSYSFTSTANSVPLTGAGDVKIEATGYRTRVVAVPAASVSSPLNALGTIDLKPLVTVTGAVVMPTGVVAAGRSVTASATGQTTKSATIVADPDPLKTNEGTFTITGLTSTGEGGDVTWTIASDLIGYGIASTTVVVTPISDAPSSITLSSYVKQKLDITFTVTSGGSPVDANISVAGGTATATGADGILQVTTVDEAPTISYQLTATGKLTYTSTIDVVAAGTRTFTPSVALANRLTTLSGTASYTGAATGDTIKLCTTSGTCNTGQGTQVATATLTGTSAPFAFSFTSLSLDTGDYWIQGGSGQNAFATKVTVLQTGATSPSTITLP